MTAGPEIHPLAVVESGARLGAGVKIGPFCHVGAQVRIDDEAQLTSHAVVVGRTHIGARTKIHPFACLGHPPQDLKYCGEESCLEIGADCAIREGATLHPGTAGGGMRTLLGARCLVMAGAHVAHDCLVGDDVILANNVLLAGHVRIGDFAVLGGGVAVVQHARIGAHAYVGGLSGLEGDLIPYGLAFGNRARLRGLNLVGMRRRHFPREGVASLRRAYRMLFAQEGTLAERMEDVEAAYPSSQHVQDILKFLREGENRPLCRPALDDAAD